MTNPSPQPPVARRVETIREHHGDRVVDPYEWLRDKGSPEVVAHLEAENAYTEAMTAHLAPLTEQVYDEIRTRTQETDLSVPSAYRGWWYYSRISAGEQYGRECRVPVRPGELPPELTDGAPPAGEQVLLDAEALAADADFFGVGSSEISHDGTLYAYAVDLTGDEVYDLVVTWVGDDPTRTGPVGEVVDDAVHKVGYGLAFSRDGRHVFYARNDDAWRQFQVWRHEVGTPADQDVLVHEETDERFWVGVGSSRDDAWIIIAAGSKDTSETWLLPADDPCGEPRCVAPRREGVEYDAEPAGDRLLITHNATHEDFELAQAPLGSTSAEDWQSLYAAAPGERVVGVDAFQRHAVVSLRRDGLTALAVMDRTDDPVGTVGPGGGGFGPLRPLVMDEELGTIGVGDNPDYASHVLRIGFTSLVTPRSVYDVDLVTGERTLLRQTPVLGGVDLGDYVQHREWATAADGTRIPISVVHRKDVVADGTAPGLVYGYGSYEASMDPWFSVARLSLLDRGFVWALAHVRGGGEMGRQWYLQGRMQHKRNTFTDFVACAEHLVDAGWVAPDRLVAEGGSAGGLLMGAVANLAPDRFRAIHAQVPFVDALTTILDPSLPLTVGEWEEWGNPLADPEVYAYMKGYSPYDNVAARPYPAILATTSLNDSRVYYVEPAKWVARLRELATNDLTTRPILLKTEMVAGHGGVSGRYHAWREAAFEYAWLIDQAGASS